MGFAVLSNASKGVTVSLLYIFLNRPFDAFGERWTYNLLMLFFEKGSYVYRFAILSWSKLFCFVEMIYLHFQGQFRGRTEIAPDQREKFLQRFQQVQQQGQSTMLGMPPLAGGNHKQFSSQPQNPLLQQVLFWRSWAPPPPCFSFHFLACIYWSYVFLYLFASKSIGSFFLKK